MGSGREPTSLQPVESLPAGFGSGKGPIEMIRRSLAAIPLLWRSILPFNSPGSCGFGNRASGLRPLSHLSADRLSDCRPLAEFVEKILAFFLLIARNGPAPGG